MNTSAGDIIYIKDLIISAAAGPAVRNSKAQAAAATVVDSTEIGACTKKRIQEGQQNINVTS